MQTSVRSLLRGDKERGEGLLGSHGGSTNLRIGSGSIAGERLHALLELVGHVQDPAKLVIRRRPEVGALDKPAWMYSSEKENFFDPGFLSHK